MTSHGGVVTLKLRIDIYVSDKKNMLLAFNSNTGIKRENFCFISKIFTKDKGLSNKHSD
jgi:hypothetical protein